MILKKLIQILYDSSKLFSFLNLLFKFLFYYYYYFLLYNIVLVLPYINMNLNTFQLVALYFHMFYSCHPYQRAYV